jgi:hypothetical protein
MLEPDLAFPSQIQAEQLAELSLADQYDVTAVGTRSCPPVKCGRHALTVLV